MTQRYPDDAQRRPSVAFYAGSFNPFTMGHASIVERALTMFDRVVIAIGVNADKPATEQAVQAQNAEAIRRLYAECPEVEVTTFSTLAVEAARECGATVLLRGVRSVADFEYERQMADINRRLPGGLETVMLPALPEYGAVSSSIVRELRRYGADVAPFLPAPCNKER